ncbi:hypothetical protein DL93DRAFT_2086083 [Clavulina sp. PMI_390]|nr:hypothetical protein DL93DRAFT_2086083 [Clavulina sp. PMI_390]
MASYEELALACNPSLSGTSTPGARPQTPPNINVAAVAALMSPPILRSPTITGPSLHKKYSAQDFRQPRLSPTSASRPPSTHVDAFDNETLSPRVSPISPSMQTAPLSPVMGLQSPVMIYHPI